MTDPAIRPLLPLLASLAVVVALAGGLVLGRGMTAGGAGRVTARSASGSSAT